jgi:TatD DNase family protein
LGNKNQAQAFLDLGWYLSFTGIITFKNAAPELLEVVRETPLERMLVETDAPFLTPVPYRGKRNEPAYVVEVAKKIAELKAITVEEVDRATSDAARAVFLSAKSVVQ